MKQHTHKAAYLSAIFLPLLALTLLLIPLPTTQAANPSEGTLNATSTTALTWTGTAVGAGAAPTNGESTCVDGVNCDTYTLKVMGAPADYAGKLISVRIHWTNPANDYDLYIHKGSNAGPEVGRSAGGAPQTSEEAAIDPATLTPDANNSTTYTVHVVYFAVTPDVDQYQGTVTLQSKPVARTANYVQGGGITFSPNVRVKAPVARRDGEPSNRTDAKGNAYVAGIRGVPAGVDLWYFDLRPGSPTYDPYMRNPIYRGEPDSFTASQSTSVGADGGGDVDIAVGMPDPATGAVNNPPTLAFTSLVAANVSTSSSSDRGQTFTKNPLGNATGGVPVDDREWIEFYGKDSVYLLYRTLEPAVTQIQKSNDGGVTYGPARTAGAIGQVGSIDVHQASGTVYISGSTGMVCVGTPDPVLNEPTTYNCNKAASDPNGVAHLFFSVKVADDGTPFGTAYVAYSNDHDIYLTHSTDKGAHWSVPARVSNGPETLTSVEPWLETGPTPGSVGIVWYGTTEATNNNNADWKVFFAQSFNATSDHPTFTQVTASDHFIHGSNISEGGTLGNANRNLIDYFQISFDPTGAAVLAYTDDHNDFDGHTYVTRQISGPGIKGTQVPAPKEGAALPPRSGSPSQNDPQVVDFAKDVQVGLVGVIPTNDPLDILSIKYSCEDHGAGTTASNPMLVATMKVSDLSTVPAAANWRMNFTANAPYADQLSPTGDYSFGLSDRGDQFYVRASTDPTQPSFSFGTAVRNSDGSVSYTQRGLADSGAFDKVNNAITVKIAFSKLNQFIPAGHPQIAVGSILVGLRGQTFTAGANAKTDIARGGTSFTIQFGEPSGDGEHGGEGGGHGNVEQAEGDGSIDGKAESFDFEVENNFDDPSNPPSGQLVYNDNAKGLQLVSDSIDTFTQNAGNPNEVTFIGHGHVNRNAVTFTVTVQDNKGTGTDFFSITISGYPGHSGTLSQGRIRFER